MNDLELMYLLDEEGYEPTFENLAILKEAYKFGDYEILDEGVVAKIKEKVENKRKLRELERKEADARANGNWKSEDEARGSRIDHILNTVDKNNMSIIHNPRKNKALTKSRNKVNKLTKKYEKEREQRKKEFASEYGEDIADREFAKTKRPIYK